MSLAAARLRPGPGAESWLDDQLRELQSGDPLQPLTVIVPSNYAGLFQRRRLARSGYANIRHSVLGRLAELLGGPRLAAAGRSPLTAITEESAIRAALRRAGGLGPQTEHRAVVLTLRGLFRDLADSGLAEAQRDALGDQSQLARIAIHAYEEYRRLLVESRLYDAADLCAAAVEAITTGEPGWLPDVGPLIIFLPTRLSAPELSLIAAAGEVATVRLGLPSLDDPEADAEPQRWTSVLQLDWDALAGVPVPMPAPADLKTRVLAAPDAGEEVRAAVRMVLGDLESGVPLHRTAMVYRHQEPYQQMVRETLSTAGVPWLGLGGKPVAASFAGRGLLGLLHLQGRRFSRGAVMNWLSSLPHGTPGPSLAQWDRISRRAGIVRTVQQWDDRLKRKLEEDRRIEAELEKEGDDATLARRSYRRGEIAATEAMRRRILDMDRRTRPPEPATWKDLAEWAAELRELFIPAQPGWPADQVEAARLVDETLAAMSAAGALDAAVSVERFVETLEEALNARRQPEGKLGMGVVTGPLSGISGMSFDRVYVLGMSERAYPTPPPVDPIFPLEAGHDPLGRAERRLSAERMSYLGALASSSSALLSFATHDTEQRPAYPARWLLDDVARLAGSRIGPGELRELRDDGTRPWLTSLASTEAALRHGPQMLNLAERRVHEARDVTVLHKADLAGTALAGRDDLPLQRGLAASQARASATFTEFDGNVAGVAADLSKLAGGLSRLHPISPSGVEQWAQCPFRYFLGRVLEVEPTERPEDTESWAISAIDRGSLIHGILEEFFRELQQGGRPGPLETYTQADRELLAAIAQKNFRLVEDLGQTGYRLAWLNEQSAILLDLETLLGKDEEFRAKNLLKPEFFEQGFGWEQGRQEGWPAAEVTLSDGSVVRLRGYIDRVDFADGAAYVTDYKTGSNMNRREFDDDPVVAGTKVQLAVYSNAVRRHLEERHLPVHQVTASYWFISPKGKFQRVEVADADASDQRLAQVMEVVNEGLTAGAFPQVPGEERTIPKRAAWSNCNFCDYHRICPTGRDQIHERKKNEPGANLHARLALS